MGGHAGRGGRRTRGSTSSAPTPTRNLPPPLRADRDPRLANSGHRTRLSKGCPTRCGARSSRPGSNGRAVEFVRIPGRAGLMTAPRFQTEFHAGRARTAIRTVQVAKAPGNTEPAHTTARAAPVPGKSTSSMKRPGEGMVSVYDGWAPGNRGLPAPDLPGRDRSRHGSLPGLREMPRVAGTVFSPRCRGLSAFASTTCCGGEEFPP